MLWRPLPEVLALGPGLATSRNGRHLSSRSPAASWGRAEVRIDVLKELQAESRLWWSLRGSPEGRPFNSPACSDERARSKKHSFLHANELLTVDSEGMTEISYLIGIVVWDTFDVNPSNTKLGGVFD